MSRVRFQPFLARTRAAIAAVGAALAASAAGCRSEPTGPSGSASSAVGASAVVLATERADYAAGDAVAVTLTNRGLRDVTYGACGSYALERQAGAEWRAAYVPVRPEACITILSVVPPGRTARLGAVPLPAGLAAGAYRVRFPQFDGGVTNAFQVR
jgi:hypothetical protein